MIQSFVDFIMPFTIAIIMLGIGLELKFRDFQRVFIYPKAILTGVLAQIFALPLIAFLLVYFWPMNPIYKVGFILLAACPGGTASNLVTKILNGRIALSISMTAFNSFIILFSIPAFVQLGFIVFLGKEKEFELGFWQTTQQVFFTVIIPVIVGIIINQLSGDKFSQKLKKPLKYGLPVLLIGSLLSVAFLDDSNKEINYLDHLYLFIPLLIFNGITMLAGFFIGRSLHLNHESNFTIAIELGLQNTVLALFVANQLIDNSALSTVAILYSSFSFISTIGIAFFMKKKWKKLSE